MVCRQIWSEYISLSVLLTSSVCLNIGRKYLYSSVVVPMFIDQESVEYKLIHVTFNRTAGGSLR